MKKVLMFLGVVALGIAVWICLAVLIFAVVGSTGCTSGCPAGCVMRQTGPTPTPTFSLDGI